ncbi:DUF1365 domain-containing protein [Duganella vulcania]|uniref:DUF1365 family protein n=1 Tax=Duganella vulcania TaxID=2692166 RepID=A0A845GNW5_9BURK|nr:DUF1365 family protein [Duganella vulcania]
MSRPAAELVHGQVMHARLRPAPHRFVYPLFYVRLNLARLDECGTRWFGVDCWRPLSVRRRDYGPRDGSSLEQWMRALLREHRIEADGEIWLQTFPRVAGYVFNPVSFWHCHDAAGRLCAVLAEVNNTFGETHRYLMRVAHSAGGTATATADKQLHVSPFCAVRGHYRFRFRLDGASHCTGLDYDDGDGPLLRTALSGRPVPMTGRAVAGALLRYPLLGLGIVFRIHWQALRLWLKRVPWFSKPPAPDHPTTVHQETAR